MNQDPRGKRRRILKLAAILAGAVMVSAAAARAESLTAMLGGGAYGDGQTEAYAKPFEAETGIKVNAVKDQISLAKVKLMVESGTVDVDVFSLAQADAIVAARRGYLQDLDYSLFDPKELAGIAEAARKPWGVPSLYYAYVLGVSTKAYPSGKPRPESWADFWNAERFPGTRVLQAGQLGAEGPWEEALLADGVAPDQLYPLDLDRIFRSLDKVKPQIRKWWTVGSEVQQLFGDGIAELGMSYDGRLAILQKAGKPVDIVYNGGKINWSSWCIPKGAPNAAAAKKFVAFATRAKQQAIFAKLTTYGPTNLGAFDYIEDQELAHKLTSHPDHFKTMHLINVDWYTEVGPDGKTNTERLIERWNAWILK